MKKLVFPVFPVAASAHTEHFSQTLNYSLPKLNFLHLTTKSFSNFYLPYKKQLLFLSFHWISVVSKGPAPLCYKSKYVVGPSSPTHTAKQDFVGPSSPRCLRLSGPSSCDHTYSKTRLCGAQLPHTVSDYQGPAPLIISHRVQLADLDDRSLITNSQICQLHFLLRISTCKPHFHIPP